MEYRATRIVLGPQQAHNSSFLFSTASGFGASHAFGAAVQRCPLNAASQTAAARHHHHSPTAFLPAVAGTWTLSYLFFVSSSDTRSVHSFSSSNKSYKTAGIPRHGDSPAGRWR